MSFEGGWRRGVPGGWRRGCRAGGGEGRQAGGGKGLARATWRTEADRKGAMLWAMLEHPLRLLADQVVTGPFEQTRVAPSAACAASRRKIDVFTRE